MGFELGTRSLPSDAMRLPTPRCRNRGSIRRSQRRSCRCLSQDPAGDLKPAKDKSTERIDGIVALIMAIGRALVAQEQPQPEYSLFFV